MLIHHVVAGQPSRALLRLRGTVFWEPQRKPDAIGVAVGGFADPSFPEPRKRFTANIGILGFNFPSEGHYGSSGAAARRAALTGRRTGS
jgi:hypothetical protein